VNRGDVVIIPFPYSDLSATKPRPVVVLRRLPGDDFIACAITSQQTGDPNIIPLVAGDFSNGSLPRASYVHPAKIFTAESSKVTGFKGTLRTPKTNELLDKVVEILRG